MQYSTTALAALGFAAISSAHMIMTTPVPYGKSTLNNSPLAADGSDYPCKLRGTTFEMEDASNVMAIGSSQSLAFQGSAVHGGGSCQVSIATLPSGKTLSTLSDSDAKSLQFKVIHSIQGGCPEMDITGNAASDSASAVDPSKYNFTIPDSVPAGNATMAWTWFNKIGNREMYMNCAPVTITGSSSTKRDTSAFDALPDMFTANIGNQCTSQDSKDLVFPEPGDSLVNLGGSTASSALATPTGAGCQAKVAAASGASSAAAASTSAAATSAPAAASTSVASGVFVTTPAAATTTVAAATTSAAAATTSAVAATSVAPVASPVSSAAAASGTATTGSGAAITAGTACTTEGMFNCISGTSYQQCASGTWSVVMPVADGTQCTVGQSMAINITATSAKRDLQKFPREHIRRHLQRSI